MIKFKITKTKMGCYTIGVSLPAYNPLTMRDVYQKLYWNVVDGKPVFSSDGLAYEVSSKEVAKSMIKQYVQEMIVITVDEQESIEL